MSVKKRKPYIFGGKREDLPADLEKKRDAAERANTSRAKRAENLEGFKDPSFWK